MDILMDASAILAVLLNEPNRDTIIQQTEGAVLVAPGCIEYEIGNAISALYKRKLLEVSDGILLWHEFCKIPLRQLMPPVASALTLAGTESIYAYDAYYLSLAEQLRIPLLTLDTRMREAATRRGIPCVEV